MPEAIERKFRFPARPPGEWFLHADAVNKYCLTDFSFRDAKTAEEFVALVSLESQQERGNLILRRPWWNPLTWFSLVKSEGFAPVDEENLLGTEPTLMSNRHWRVLHPPKAENVTYQRENKPGFFAEYSEAYHKVFPCIKFSGENYTNISPAIVKILNQERRIALRIWDAGGDGSLWEPAGKLIQEIILRNQWTEEIDASVVVFRYGNNPLLDHYLRFDLAESHASIRIMEVFPVTQR